MADSPAYPGAPRWAKIFGGVLLALVLLFVVLKLTGVAGRHGPGRHLPTFGETRSPSAQPHEPPPPGAHPAPAVGR